METHELLERISPVLAAVPGVAAVAPGGSRASGAAHSASDTDIGLCFSERAGVDLGAHRSRRGSSRRPERRVDHGGRRLGTVDRRAAAGSRSPARRSTFSSGRSSGSRKSFRTAGTGASAMNYQPGHPHGFCSAISNGRSRAMPPASRSSWRYRYELVLSWPPAVPTHCARTFQSPPGDWNFRVRSVVGGDASRRSLACVAQALFALNHRYLINEKGAIEAAARLPLTVAGLSERAARVWQAVGLSRFDAALAGLRSIERDLTHLTGTTG